MQSRKAKVKMVPLADVAVIERVGVDAVEMEGNSYVSLEDLDSVTGEVRLVARAASKSAKFRFGPEHVLYGKLRPYLQKVARPLVCGFCSTDILPIRPNNELDRDYLFHFLRTPEFTAKASQAAVGINLPRLSPSVLSTFHIPLPPLSEQRRIATILDKADELRAKRRAALKKLDELTQSIFLDMFGRPKENPKMWPMVSLMEICFPKQWPTISTSEFTDIGFAVFGANGLIGYYNAYNHEKPTVLITCRGATCGTINVSPPKCYVTGNAMALDNIDEERITNEYLAAVLRERGMRDAISGTAQPQITRQSLAHVMLPLPPLSLQKDFTSRIEQIQQMKSHQHKSLEALDALFSSLQYRAFRGEL